MTWYRPNSPAGRITSPFGERVPPYPGASSYHLGVDLRAGVSGVDGSIYAASAGVVSSRYVTTMGAQVVIIDHGGGITTRYVHMPADGIYVRVGDRVAGGQRIAIAGMSGAATVHLHFETRVNGKAVDPVPFLRARGVDLTVVTVSNPVGGGGGTITTPTLPGAPAPITPEDIIATIDELKQAILEVAGPAVWGHTLEHGGMKAPAIIFMVDTRKIAGQIATGDIRVVDGRTFGEQGLGPVLGDIFAHARAAAGSAADTVTAIAGIDLDLDDVELAAIADRLAATLGATQARTLGEALVRGAQG